MKDIEIKRAVRDGYARIARQGSSCCSSSSCCGNISEEISKRIGYTEEELQAAPQESNLGLGCGNPIALAALREGDTVLDLGSGAGFDCFLASRKVGNSGMVIGVDMTTEMVDKARANARKGNYTNIDFRQGELENLPVADNYVDVVISNCVINLVPDKKRVFKEAFRVLKPGGRLMVSDIVKLRDLPKFVEASTEAYVGCVTGAAMKEDYLDAVRSVGFREVKVQEESKFQIDCLAGFTDSGPSIEIPSLSPERLEEVASAISSIKVSAIKPE